MAIKFVLYGLCSYLVVEIPIIILPTAYPKKTYGSISYTTVPKRTRVECRPERKKSQLELTHYVLQRLKSDILFIEVRKLFKIISLERLLLKSVQ